MIILKHSDQVPEAISRLPAIDDASDSILDSVSVFFYISVNVSLLAFVILEKKIIISERKLLLE